MDCIRAQQLIKGYMEGQLSDRDLEAFLDHVAGCRKCYDELEIYFSVYHLIDDRKDDGNYNFIEKLNLRLEKSRDYLRRRLYYKIFRVVLVVLAELVLMMSVIGAYTYRYRMDQEEIRTIYKGLKNITVADKSEMSITDCYHFVAFTFEDGTSYGYRFEGTGLLVYGSDNYDISGGGDLFGYMQEKCTSEQ